MTGDRIDAQLAPIGLLRVDDRLAIRTLNAEAERLLGLSEEAVGGNKPLADVIYHDCGLLDLARRALASDRRIEASAITVKGPHLPTRTVAAWAQPRDSGLDLAIGSAAGAAPAQEGIETFARILGHEVKNPLAGISGAAQLLQRQGGTETEELSSLIISEVGRIERLVTRLSALELYSEPRLGEVNINRVADRVVKAEQAAQGTGVAIAAELDPSLPAVEAEEDHIHQALSNLVRNACEAASDTPAGAPAVTVRSRFLPGFAIRSRAGGAARRAMQLEVQDNGGGIPAATRPKLFHLFASTKESGRGVGLAVVAQIVEAHGGTIDVDSVPGDTRFKVTLPLALT